MKAIRVTVAFDNWSELNEPPKWLGCTNVFCYRADVRTMVIVATDAESMQWASGMINQLISDPVVCEIKSGM